MNKKIDKLKAIAGSYINALPEGESWYEDRLAHCLSCEHNTAVSGNDSILDTIKEKTIAPKGSCKICTCPVDRKCSVKTETCALYQLGKKPLWEAIEAKSPNDSNITVENLSPEVISLVPTPDSTFVVKITEVKPLVTFQLKLTSETNLEVKNFEVPCTCVTPTYDAIDAKSGVVGVGLSTTGFKKGLNKRYLIIHYYKTATKTKTFTIEFQTEIK